ncbi:2'-5' RNA ligase family protein [Protofrankia symbiont of Coriaria ruscifolia]|uniref:2'-5' RNA ligase family protein n=1 Tax=Protofrankia symbiont of Coriaria ruscifolia TaxID=1306542 RepID=UPI0010410015|nr:2'-5' RNA ligase family protein [Protofrankia symbiont of Coriaria ruscifolia]
MTREQWHVDTRREAFARLERMRDHWWWRPGWKIGRSFYTFHITFDGASEVIDLVGRYQQALTLPTLDLVPAEGLHLTMQGVGFTDEVTRVDLDGIIIAAQAHCARLTSFAVTLGPADADPEAVMLQVAPWQPVEELRAAVRAAIADVWGDSRVPETADGFTPHVSVAYSGADTSAVLLRQRLSGIEPMSVTTTVRAVQLIELNRDQRAYRWTTIATMPLRG